MRKARFIFNRYCLSPLLGKGITATYSPGSDPLMPGLRVYCKHYTNSNICLEHGTTPFWDSIQDMKANHLCAGWETFALGTIGGWIGSLFRDSCENCCSCKLGDDDGDL